MATPLSGLITSRRFWLLILDTVISLTLYFAAKYAAPSAVEDVRVVILAIQPVFLMLIGAYTVDNVQQVKAGGAPGANGLKDVR